MTARRATIDWLSVHQRVEASERALEAMLSPSKDRVRETLIARAEALARRHVEQREAGDIRRYLLLRARSSAFALDLAHVGEVGQLERCTPVPGGPAHLVGVFAHRGDVHSLLDLGVLLGTEPPEGVHLGCFVHVRPPRGRVGGEVDVWLRVDELDRVREIKPAEILPFDPSSSQALNAETETFSRRVEGVTHDGVFVLRANSLGENQEHPRADPALSIGAATDHRSEDHP